MTDPASVKPGEVWAVEPPKWADGTWIGIRYGHGSRAWWLESTTDIQEHEKVSDDDVVLLHRLVPARPVTRDDLPDAVAVAGQMRETDARGLGFVSYAGDALDAVVAHLNARGGVPESEHRAELMGAYGQRDRLRVLRDEAVARAEKAEAERDEARRWLRDTEELLDAEKARVRGLEADDDPVVYVIRESEIAAVEVTRDRFGFWCSDGDPWVKVGVPAEVARGDQAGRMRAVARHEAVARAIEAVEADRDTAAARACEAAGLTCDEWDELPGQARDMLVQAWREGLAS